MKAIKLGGLIAAAAIVSMLNMNIQPNDNISLLKFENIEALASGEDTPSVTCSGGSVVCATVNTENGQKKFYKS